MAKKYENRFYRLKMNVDRFVPNEVKYKDTDLWIGIDKGSFCEEMKTFILGEIIEYRKLLESYIKKQPEFHSSLKPVHALAGAPELVRAMCDAAKIAGTGPMAGVAGAFSQYIGKAILSKFKVSEILIENGGDIFVVHNSPLVVSLYAGDSPLSDKVGINIPESYSPIGICTSSGTVGPSLSFGKADAVMVACKNTVLADTLATSYCNQVQTEEDIPSIIEASEKIPDILGIVAVKGEKMGIRGNFKLVPL